MNTSTLTTLEWAEKRGACELAKGWIRRNNITDPITAWRTCPNIDWLLWAAFRPEVFTMKQRCEILLTLIEPAVGLMSDDRSLKAVEAIKLCGNGRIILAELHAAAADAAYAADAANAAHAAHAVAEAIYAIYAAADNDAAAAYVAARATAYAAARATAYAANAVDAAKSKQYTNIINNQLAYLQSLTPNI